MKKYAVLIVVFVLGTASILSAHGLVVDVRQESPFVVVQPKYSEGQPAGGASVVVRFEGEETPYQAGACDVRGLFVFSPDKPGEWTLVADDGRGHRQQTVVTIDLSFFETPAAPESIPAEADVITREIPFVPLWMKVGLGLAVIFGLTGLFYGFKSNRDKKPGGS
ncbi:MAG: hypothetical protein KKD56_08770 [Acidobacteria bacterium]|nr:hypothetical protein [Acidobacteriota bacterium]MBU1339146.1 hypothetical protein [Acidobacteriota bacterium]MBU1475032.1 hypothetical protein [Acidobacteriota bacterium]